MGLPAALLVRIFEEYGNKMYDILKTNPYKLAEDITGIGFRAAGCHRRQRQELPLILFSCLCGNFVFFATGGTFRSCLSAKGCIMPERGTALSGPEFIEDHLMELVLDKKL